MLHLTIQDDIAELVLDNAPVNALSLKWAQAFNAELDRLEARDDWRVLRIRSALKLFSAGGDLKQFAARLSEPDAGEKLSAEAAIYQQLFNRISALPQLSIAEISGVAAGGGFELALACDIRVMASSARVGLPEVGVGLLPSANGTQRMTRLIGIGRAIRLIGLAELISAQEALSLGLVEFVFDDASIIEEVGNIARRLASQPREALRAAKSCILAAVDPERDGSREELEAPKYLMKSAETRARITQFTTKSATSR
jgi:enoyl-CoA hydratase/carnithine racemase